MSARSTPTMRFRALHGGKFVDDGSGRKVLGMSLEVNHRFIDGYHISQFVRFLEAF